MSSPGDNRQRLRRAMWAGGDAESVAAMMGWGALVWGVYCAFQIVFNGVVLDESVLPGQIIANAVPYPAGHPHDVFYRQAYSFSHFAAAGLWALGLDEIGISALRNWLFLFTSIMAVFSVAIVLTRRPSWAHAAVAVALLGAYLRFEGTYPMWVFPAYYSNGHIGLQVAVISAAMLAGGLWRTGGILLGALPALHVTMSLVAWPWAFLYLAFTKVYARAEIRRRFGLGMAAGLAVSVALAALVVLLPQPQPAVSPYVGDAVDGESVRESYIALTDRHRAPLPLYTFGYLLNPAAFAALGVLVWAYLGAVARRRGDDDTATSVAGVIAIGGLAWAIVFGTWALLQIGGWLPDAVVISMPWRFSNVSAILLVPFTLAGLSGLTRRMPEQEAAVTCALVIVTIFAAGVASSALVPMVGRGLVGGNIIMALWGLLLGGALWNARRAAQERIPALVASALLLAASAAFFANTRIVVYIALAAVVAVVVLSVARRLPPMARRRGALSPALVAAVVICAVAALPDRDSFAFTPNQPRWDIVSDDDRLVVDFLEANAAPEEMVLVAYYYPRAELQAKAAQPVLLELETLQIMTYMPRLAGVIGEMTRDLYGVEYGERLSLPESCGVTGLNEWCELWSRRWRERTRADWVALAEKYGFRYVLAPRDPALDLTPVVSGERVTMYSTEG